jgi:hypothetical protein
MSDDLWNNPPVNSKKQSGADIAYTGLATYGMFNALIGAVLATIFGIIIIIVGIMELRSKSTTMINGIIQTINNSQTGVCPATNSAVNSTIVVTYNCTLQVSFTHKGTTYNPLLYYSGPTNYTVGQPITVYFQDDPNILLLAGNNPSGGWIAIVLGIGIIAFSWIMFWSAKKWKTVAALQGGASVINSLGGGSRGGGGMFNGGGMMGGINMGGLFNGVKF